MKRNTLNTISPGQTGHIARRNHQKDNYKKNPDVNCALLTKVMRWSVSLVICPMCYLSPAEAVDFSARLSKFPSLITPPKRSPTLHGQGWHNFLIHVIHIVRHDEVGGVWACTAHPAGIYVEGSHQWVDAGVVNNLEATEDLNLLPAVQALPQCCCHLAQCLPEDKWKTTIVMDWMGVPKRMRTLLKGTSWEDVCEL